MEGLNIGLDGMPEDLWSPYKHFYRVVQKTLLNPGEKAITELGNNFKKYKQVFGSLLKNPPKNESSRNKLYKGVIEGFSNQGCNPNLSKDLIDETIIISDMFDLDEYIALELLCTAQRQMPQNPGLPRGLVAVLLYYDGRKAITYALRDLFQATSGVSWVTDLPKEITNLISTFTQSLEDDCSITERIIDLLEKLNASEEMLLLAKNRALGPKKHQNQVMELFEDIRLALATSLFNWSAQRGLSKASTIKLLKSLNNYKASESSGIIDNVTLTVLMTLLHSYDASGLQRYEDSNNFLQKMPFLNEPEYIQEVFAVLDSNSICDRKNGLIDIAKFAFGLSLARLRQVPQNWHNSVSKLIERDEYLIDEALSNNIFEFMYYCILERNIIYEAEFFYRRFHVLFTDFIDLMHSKLTELRGKADETSKAITNFNKEGLEPPSNLDHNFEMLMLCIGKFYKNDRAGLALCTEYWEPLERNPSYSKSAAYSVSLFKFIRLAGELLPTTLFVPYMKMIAGLTSCERSARNAFNLLKQSSQLSGSTTLSWEHFFGSLTRYYMNLRQERSPGSDYMYKNQPFNRDINPCEIEGLHAVLEIIEGVAKHDEIARISICEHPNWDPLNVLLGLLGCSVPLSLKVNILKTLSALGKSKETAIKLWDNIEVSQIITTTPNTGSYSACNIETEIEQIECRLEIYPLTKAVLDLLYSLVTTVLPKNLGAGSRKPGFDPYLKFILNGIFLKFDKRAYKVETEKWEIAEKCLKLLYYLQLQYEIKPQDFIENVDSSPGFHIMLQLHTKSNMLSLILFLIDDARLALDDYKKFNGKEIVEECVLHCLNILETGLARQEIFFEAHSIANTSTLLSGLNKILMDINPRSKKPDHILNTTKFVTYSNWLPQHALVAINILNMICKLPSVASQILDMFTQNEFIEKELRHGFVECLETELLLKSKTYPMNAYHSDVKIDLKIKEAIIELLLNCIQQPAPNITQFLLGFDLVKDPNINKNRKIISMNSTSNCVKSIICLLDNHLEVVNSSNDNDADTEKVIELAYSVLYSLCANTITSDFILRYLRLHNDFLYRHLSALPFRNTECSYVLHQASLLLKCIAIELKVTASNGQISRFQHFYRLLVGTLRKYKMDDNSMELSLYNTHSTNIFSEILNTRPQEKNFDMLLCQILDNFEFDAKYQQIPKFEFFDNAMTEQVLKECEVITTRGLKLVNIKKLHELLADELRAVQITIASGQRKLILQEIESVLSFAVKLNDDRSKSFANVKVMEAWSQVTEILFSCAPESTVPPVIKGNLILEILQKLIIKIISIEPNLEMSILASGTILLLLVNIQNGCQQTFENSGFKKNNNTSVNDEKFSEANTKTSSLSLKFITKNILEWIIRSGLTSQKLRINLYAALLNCLRIANMYNAPQSQNTNEDRLDKMVERQKNWSESSQTYSDIINLIVGDELVNIICNDSICGHDICKMTALSCVDLLLNSDNASGFIRFVTKRGYWSHIIKNLQNSDEDLCNVMCNSSENLKSLYIYESEMAVLIRLANSHIGAEILLVEKIVDALSHMKVFDFHPGIRGNVHDSKNEMNEFIPPLDERFRQILFPALNLCDCIISTLGTENNSVVSQIMHFILAHYDMFEMVLRTGYLNKNNLQELASVTGLIARTTNQENIYISDIYPNSDERVNFYRIQRLMMSLFSRFIIKKNIFENVALSEDVMSESFIPDPNLYIKNFLEIAANLSLFCRNALANHTADHRANVILFSANIAESLHSNHNSSSNIKTTHGIGMILDLLMGSVKYSNFQQSLLEGILRQRSTLANINFDASAKKKYVELTENYNNVRFGRSICALIAEQCLYLLWNHLDFFARYAIEKNSGNKNVYITKSCASEMLQNVLVSLDDIISLKKLLISILNETFCRQLTSASEIDDQFNEGLLRRIQFIIQIITVR